MSTPAPLSEHLLEVSHMDWIVSRVARLSPAGRRWVYDRLMAEELKVEHAESQAAMLPHYSRALDEIYRLRTTMALVAFDLSTHFATMPRLGDKRERLLADVLARMRRSVQGIWPRDTYGESARLINEARRRLGMPETLTRAEWERP